MHLNPGDKYGRLTVVAEVEGSSYSRRILCKCDCGKNKIVDLVKLLNGNTKSCGCLKKELRIKQNTTHGLTNHPLYTVWNSMKGRCMNPKDPSYRNYGARGISICDEWLDFRCFYEWAMASGYTKGLTIERINNDGDYCPENCCWIPREEQSANRRMNRFLTFAGQTKTMSQWAKEFGLKRETIRDRIKRGWSVEKAITTPILKEAI